ncbi:MAG: bifunctional acetate--CoA ligase family protein/GNAT family N-acetyltransferase [Burkholderiaceae bacterium]
MGPGRLEPLFNPQSIAVFGASIGSRSVGSLVYANLLGGGFAGRIVPVNPRHADLDGTRCLKHIGELDVPVDLAVIATPARTVEALVADCARAGIHHAIILSAGFGETGAAGRAREARLLQAARRHGVRLVGPNCVGLARPWQKLDATFLRTTAPAGSLAVVSQSGALCAAIADWAEPHHLGLSALVSMGNSADLDFGEVLDFLSTDPRTGAILLYVEGIKQARSFLSALRIAARQKPVVIIKAGRHQQSAQAAHTHTGALIGSDAVFDAAIESVGAVRAHSFGQLFSAAEVLGAGVRVRGSRLAIITNGGGAGVLAADHAADLAIALPSPGARTLASLNEHLPAYWSQRNPVDILGDASAEIYRLAVAACLQDDAFDAVLVMLTPQAITDALDAARAVIAARSAHPGKPVLACWMGETSVTAARTMLSAAGIADFTTPERAVEAFSWLARHERNRQLALETPSTGVDAPVPDLARARELIHRARQQGRQMLSSAECRTLLACFGIPVNPTLAVGSREALVAACERLGWPVAIKIDAEQVTHKTDVGGVRLNVANAEEALGAYDAMLESVARGAPQAPIEGVTVEPMIRDRQCRELALGIARDPVFGATLLFGAGGTMIELLRDTAVALPPLNEVLAERLIRRTRVSTLLDAFRDLLPADRRAVVQVLLRLSDLASELPEVLELDINPLLAGPDGAIVIDARVRITDAPPAGAQHPHLAILPYPRHLESRESLPNGAELLIRPIRAEDAEREQAFVRNLSPQARQSRFMHAMKELTPTMLARFTQIDYSREMALVALTETDGVPTQQAVARYAINPDQTSCEFAIVVSDALQNQGIGRRLMKALIRAARGHGLQTMEGTVLADNRPMLGMIAKLGFTRRLMTDDPSIYQVELQL